MLIIISASQQAHALRPRIPVSGGLSTASSQSPQQVCGGVLPPERLGGWGRVCKSNTEDDTMLGSKALHTVKALETAEWKR